jgi:hypothetical protein
MSGCSLYGDGRLFASAVRWVCADRLQDRKRGRNIMNFFIAKGGLRESLYATGQDGWCAKWPQGDVDQDWYSCKRNGIQDWTIREDDLA